jgi:carbon monoxide dehydrogenase subunit G
MATIETSVNISKPVGKVFEFITDLDNQKKLSTYITGVEVSGPVGLGTKYVIETTSNGHVIKTNNEVVAFEADKKFGVKSYGTPPASDVTNTYLLEEDGYGTKLVLQMDAVLVPPGMPNMPGMEDMMKKQMQTGLDTTMSALKKLIEA